MYAKSAYFYSHFQSDLKHLHCFSIENEYVVRRDLKSALKLPQHIEMQLMRFPSDQEIQTQFKDLVVWRELKAHILKGVVQKFAKKHQ